MSEWSKISGRIGHFLFPSDSGEWLTILRLGLGLQVSLYAWFLRHDWDSLFATHSREAIARPLSEAILAAETTLTPRLGLLVTLGAHLGLSEDFVLTFSWLCLLGAGCCLLVGIFSRPAAFAAWFFYLCSAKSSRLLSYGVDAFTTIGLFYLMIAPLPDPFALGWRRSKRKTPDPERQGFHRRVLQIHLCIIYFFGGLSKCSGIDWWNGNSVWRALSRPPFDVIPAEPLIRFAYLFPILGILVCFLEIGYPIFIWMSRTRRVWLLAIIGMHFSIGLVMGLHLFALVMIVLNLAAFGPGCLLSDIEQPSLVVRT